MLARGDISEGHARAVLALPDDDSRLRLARRIASEGMTVRAAERAAQAGGARRRPRRARAERRRPGARRPRPRRCRAAHRPPGPRRRRPPRDPLRRRDTAGRARRDARGAVGALSARGSRSSLESNARWNEEPAAAKRTAFRVMRDRDPRERIPESRRRRDIACRKEWAILDSNQGPPPYQSGALTD